ncbi:MAG TPA: MoxR family ATPase [Gemmatimonadales bacterium]|nr:MoxR family ATPase [Gemmatimonadales bacterium]
MGRAEAVVTPPLVPLEAAEALERAGAAQAILDQVRQVVLGQEAALRDTVAALLARGHVLLEGVPGTAKTLLVRALGLTLGLEFRRIQFTPDLMPSDITGVSFLESGGFSFRPGPIFGDLVLGDEINRAPAKTQAALLEAMQERRVTVDGTSHPLPESFTVFATQNPIEFEGTYPLPEAELDRFLVKVVIGYPEERVEQGILTRVLEGFEADLPATFGIRQVADAAGLAAMRSACRRVRVEPSLVAYVTAIVRATRDTPVLTLGASPRASVALLKMAQASALLDGRAYAVPDDVKALASAVLRHRVAVAPELELEGVAPDAALEGIIEKIEAPR